MERHEPSRELRGRILGTIARDERRRAKRYLAVCLLTISTSVTGVAVSAKYAVQGIYESSFYSYLSLLFSDRDVVSSYWREFAFSLFETLPLLSITLALLALAALLVSVRALISRTGRTYGLTYSN